MVTLHEKGREKISTESEGGMYVDNGRTLTKVLDGCHSNYKISQGTERIAEHAAYRNFNLKSVDFPSSIRSIGAKAFWGCKNLQELVYETSGMKIVSIGEEAFMNCKKLEGFSSIFLKSVLFIGRGAFSGMDKLKEIELPEGLLEISAFCFGCDESLANVSIPSSVTTIGEGAFFCSGLTEIKLPDSVMNLGDFVFSTCKKLKKVQLPKHIKQIPQRTFASCKSLPYIDIPAGVKVIESLAFEGTTSLKSIRFRGKINNISTSAFQNSSIENIVVPWYLRGYYKKMFPNIALKIKIM